MSNLEQADYKVLFECWKAAAERHHRMLRDIGQYCEDNLGNTAMLTSMPPQNPVAWHVHNTVLRHLTANPQPDTTLGFR